MSKAFSRSIVTSFGCTETSTSWPRRRNSRMAKRKKWTWPGWPMSMSTRMAKRSGSADRSLHGRHDLVLIGLAQIRMHRQADDFARSLFRFGQGAPSRRAGEDRLLVQALRVINGRRDSLLFELGAERVAILHPDRVLRVDVGVARVDFGHR